MKDILEEIKSLKEKREKAILTLERAKAQIETLEDRKKELEKEVRDKFNITVDEIEGKIKEMSSQAESMLQKAKAKLKSLDKYLQ